MFHVFTQSLHAETLIELYNRQRPSPPKSFFTHPLALAVNIVLNNMIFDVNLCSISHVNLFIKLMWEINHKFSSLYNVLNATLMFFTFKTNSFPYIVKTLVNKVIEIASLNNLRIIITCVLKP
jgi:hypothetical protein